MGSFLQTIAEWATYLWPFRLVEEWERGGYYICGRYWREVGPGLKIVVPWFSRIITVNAIPAIIGTGRQDITLKNGVPLSFAATANVRVVDVYKALNTIDSYRETTQELIASVLADRIAKADAERLDPEKRGRLLADLQKWVAEEAIQFGIEVTKLRFTSFVQNLRTYRFLTDSTMTAPW